MRPGALLLADLHDAAVTPCGLEHHSAFRYGIGERLLDIHVLARLAGHDQGQAMPVVRRTDDHRVDVPVFDQIAEIRIDLRFFSRHLFHFSCAFGKDACIHVAERCAGGVGKFQKSLQIRESHVPASDQSHDQPAFAEARAFTGRMRDARPVPAAAAREFFRNCLRVDSITGTFR